MIKKFGYKRIIFRSFELSDLKRAKDFQDYINSLIEEGAQILFTQKLTLKEEGIWIKSQLDKIKKHKTVALIAEYYGKIIGVAEVNLRIGREEHNGHFGIGIKKGYRGMGVGKFFMGEILKLAKKELKPHPKIFRLSVFPTNPPARNLYELHGFKEVARIPKQIQYKGKLIDEIIMIRRA